MTRPRNPVLFISLIAVVLSGIYMAGQLSFESLERQWLDKAKSAPQYVMSNTTTIQYDKLGFERFHMRSEQLTQAQGSKVVDILKPEITLRKKQRQAWQISADSGQLLPADGVFDQQRLMLKQNVVIDKYNQHTSQGAPEVTINTSELEVLTDSKFAYSPAAVSIQTQTSLTRATGLDLDFNRGLVKLNSQVVTVTQPTPETNINPKQTNH